jgi:regulator of protease activity HflC (stomatin/prohibitin superfamily)
MGDFKVISFPYQEEETVMSNTFHNAASREIPRGAISGWPMLFINIAWVIAAIVLFLNRAGHHDGLGVLAAVIAEIVGVICFFGYFTLQPNEARVQLLFGDYKGTVRAGGFHWANPFYSRSRASATQKPSGSVMRALMKNDLKSAMAEASPPSLSTKLSLRAHNFNCETLKVNDKRGNPVEIAAVVVWRIEDTAQAAFDVEDYKSYVQVQSESALRSIASSFAYDHGESHEPTLRGSSDEVAHALKEELQVRLAKAGVVVDEARLTHLAYAPEIASVMLRRQQAEAIVAARQQIVQGAVGMVRTALQELEAQHVVELDPERKAAMVSNLLVVLCGNNDASPVINTGTLYN